MTRQTLCTLSTANLLHNLAVIKTRAPRARIMAMVKANAYGHGLRSVAQRLEGHVDALGVASIDEATALRQAGVNTPITLIEGVFAPEELALAATQGFAVVFHSAHQLRWLEATHLPGKITAWLKLDTGLGRLGFSPQDAAQALQTLSENPSIRQPVGLLSHFACADTPQHPLNKKQIAIFAAFAEQCQGPKSFCNSAALFAFPDRQQDWVRPGLALYGASPLAGRSAEELGLKPVMTFQTEIIAVQHFKRGDTVGYGAKFICPEDMPTGIIAAGYGDGYPRSLREGAPVLIGDRLCPLIGRVAMDMTAVDLRLCAQAAVGDKVTLWGKGLPIEKLTDFCDHIAYDLLTGVQNRVKFVWE
ncbi:MAG: alanine racemase [Alphaproteobacteria bacterium]|nr:alanine racemase [Alphaproteobacteria bacterium]